MHKSISIPEWHQMALEGVSPPIRITLNGCSMDPLIRIRKDYVTIAQLDQTPVIGDIVLFANPERKRYVVHRVWKLKNDQVLTWGDNCPSPDGWMPLDAIWGKVVLIERGDRRIKTHPRIGMLWARFWHLAMKGYRQKESIKKRLHHKENNRMENTGEE